MFRKTPEPQSPCDGDGGGGGGLKFERKKINARKTLKSTSKKKMGIGSPVF